MKLVAILIVTVMILSSCGKDNDSGSEQNTLWDSEDKSTNIVACTNGWADVFGSQSSDMCTCYVNKAEEKYSYEEYEANFNTIAIELINDGSVNDCYTNTGYGVWSIAELQSTISNCSTGMKSTSGVSDAESNSFCTCQMKAISKNHIYQNFVDNEVSIAEELKSNGGYESCLNEAGLSRLKLSPILDVGVGADHFCFLSSAGNAYCKGNDSYGQLGNGGTSDSTTEVGKIVGVTMPTGISFKSISSGYRTSCAIGSDNNAYCWGSGTKGQLGNGQFLDSSTPVPVTMPSGVYFKEISVGFEQVCALSSGSSNYTTPYCWGAESLGGNIGTPLSIPISVGSVNIGGSRACGKTSGSNICWVLTSNNNGTRYSSWERSLPSTTSSSISISTSGLSNYSTCAVGWDRAVYCLGKNNYGQIGNGSISTDEVTSFNKVTAPGILFTYIYKGEGTNCAIDGNGQIYCWGRGTSGQLGNDSKSDSSTPVPVKSPDQLGFSKMSMSDDEACAISKSSERLFCWGGNNSTIPVEVPGSF